MLVKKKKTQSQKTPLMIHFIFMSKNDTTGAYVVVQSSAAARDAFSPHWSDWVPIPLAVQTPASMVYIVSVMEIIPLYVLVRNHHQITLLQLVAFIV